MVKPFLAQAAQLPLTSGAAPLSSLNVLFQNVITVILGFGGLALFLMLIIGGLKWITAGGDPKAVEAARNTVTWALAGMVLLALAYLILVLIGKFTGVTTITQFNIMLP